MICFKIFKPQRTQGEVLYKKIGVLGVTCGEKIKDWPTKRPGRKE